VKDDRVVASRGWEVIDTTTFDLVADDLLDQFWRDGLER
jgi:hypothetical protein